MSQEREQELIRFILALADKLAICSELLSKCAERKDKRRD